MLMILFNFRCKDLFLEVPVLGGIFSKHLFKMWISKLSNAFIASGHINGLELCSTPNQALLKCSSFSIIFCFVRVAFILSFPKSLFSRNIRRKSFLHCFRTFEVEYLGSSFVNHFIAWNRSNLMRTLVANISCNFFRHKQQFSI